LLRSLCINYTRAGYFNKARNYNWEALQLDNDSATYYLRLAFIEEFNYNFEDAIKFNEKAFELDHNKRILHYLLWQAKYYLYLDRHEEALVYIKEALSKHPFVKSSVGIRLTWSGYAFLKNGFKEEAESYFDKQLEYHKRMMELDRESASMYWTYYDAAAAYAMKGETDLAIQNLENFNLRPRMCGREVISIKYDPMFDEIRNKPAFQRIVNEIEAKYQAEHERVRQWLEENDMI
jgi:tetratricopeptide (TPR) repeat protein